MFCAIFLSVLWGDGYAQSTPKDTLDLLTWNVFMRPRAYFWDNQTQRSEYIAEFLNKNQVDVVALQEVFGRKTARFFRKALQETYPYQYGPGKVGFMKFNSGVMILSKYPMVEYTIKKYGNCNGIDCMAKKSAVFVTLEKNGKKFQVVGTHLQASKGYANALIRTAQMKTISKLANAYKIKDAPQIFMGDFNVIKDFKYYPDMLLNLNAIDGPIVSDVKCSSDPENELCWSKKPKILDYILLKRDEIDAQIIQRKILKPQAPLKKGKKNLSDHYPVKAKLVF